MPAGLDGNPDPIRSTVRNALIAELASRIDAASRDPRTLVGVDGESGAGKSTFADELASALRAIGRVVVRSTIDSFHRPRSERYRRGRSSAEGYYLDSHQVDALVGKLLEPFRKGAPFRITCFDEPTDAPVIAPLQSASPGSILIFDGLFLHRPKLRRLWHSSVFLIANGRIKARRATWEAGASAEDVAAVRARYVDGWQLYLSDADPAAAAGVVIDNDDLANPSFVDERHAD